jgi:CBS domain-containing protein
MTTALVTGAPGDLVDQVLFEMKLSAIRHLPVVGDKGRLEGIVSDRDVLLCLGTSESKNVYLRDIMTKQVLTIGDDVDVTEALEVMIEKKVGCLPVVGDSGQLVGLVTETDFLQIAHSLLSNKSGTAPTNELEKQDWR